MLFIVVAEVYDDFKQLKNTPKEKEK